MVSELVKKITIPSNGEYLERVRNFIEKMTRECRLSESQIFDVKVAVGEACANAIEHGSPDGEKNRVEIEVVCDSSGCTIEIRDEGVFKRQAMEYDADGLHHRGRGMAFMLALMDEVDVKIGQSGTIVRMFKKRN